MNAEKMDNLWEKYIAIADIAEYQKKYLKTLGKLLMPVSYTHLTLPTT